MADLVTQRKEMYEAEKVGPGRPLKLDEGQEVTGQSAPLSEEGNLACMTTIDISRIGYHEVVLLQDPNEMQEYVERVASEMQPGLSLVLKGSFADKSALEDFLMQCSHGEFRYQKALQVARCVRLPSLHKLLDELPTLPWVEVQRPLEQVYEALLGQREDVDETATVLHLCLRSMKQLKPGSQASTLRGPPVWTFETSRQSSPEIFVTAGAAGASHRFLPPEQRPRQRTDTADSVQAKGPHQAGLEGEHEGQVSDDEAPASEESTGDDQETEALARQEGLSDRRSDASFSSSSLNEEPLREAGFEDATVGMSEPLTEEGYQAVASLRSGPAMAAFVRRVLMEEGGEVISSAGLLDFAQGFSGELGQPQSFVALQEALLRSPNWARFQTVNQGKLFVDRWFDGASKVFSVRHNIELNKYLAIVAEYPEHFQQHVETRRDNF
ncbi:unnamed protein product [Symbiodinium necroappetens]|uniref:Uncharacterized protein n=1 Tax=Symbiodinium necroappetens TaxID=1628268 RepID=A0A813A837_9DINO|nr:unnamed protein product [Symbiodinium necroappetens]